MKRISALCAPLLFVLIVLSSCTDYTYRHSVSGQVIDMNGQPVAGALVKRVVNAKSDKLYGPEAVYSRRTDMDGNFSFAYQGLEPAGGAFDVWNLVISQMDYRTERKSVTVSWTAKGKPNFGYNLNNIVFKLTKAR
jgi:hypothetical protein